jgi:hypothetical protein
MSKTRKIRGGGFLDFFQNFFYKSDQKDLTTSTSSLEPMLTQQPMEQPMPQQGGKRRKKRKSATKRKRKN